MPFQAFPGALNSWETQSFLLCPPPSWLRSPGGSELLGTRPRSDVPTACCTQVTRPVPSQGLKIRLCQLQKRCHHEQKQWGQLGHHVTSQKDMDSYNVSLICGMGVGAGLGAAVFSISITPHTLIHTPHLPRPGDCLSLKSFPKVGQRLLYRWENGGHRGLRARLCQEPELGSPAQLQGLAYAGCLPSPSVMLVVDNRTVAFK